jgi:hypothetical protein
MIFTLKSQGLGFGSPELTLEFEADDIGDVVSYFQDFLRGSGYHLNGKLEIVPVEPELPETWFCTESCGCNDCYCDNYVNAGTGDIFVDKPLV